MPEPVFLPDANGDTGRPQLLSFLGVIGFINTGFFGILYAFGVPTMMILARMPFEEYYELFAAQMATASMEVGTEEVRWFAEMLHGNGTMLMLILLVRTVVRFFGILGMWRGRKVGFHLYAGAQLIGIFIPHIILPLSLLGVGGPLLAVGMTALYGTQAKRLQ